MIVNEILCIAMFLGTMVMLMAGFPVAFTLAGASLIFAGIGDVLGVFDYSFLLALPPRILGNVMWNEVLVAVPLFVFMGVILERSRVAEDLLNTMGKAFGALRGGLGISVTLVGALLAASTGIVGATVVTMGLLSLPTMLKRGYKPSLACGNICASATLGQIIPPSIVLVVLGDQMSNAHSDAQRMLGNFSPEPVSVTDLFAGGLIPGVVLVGLYVVYQLVVALLKPETSPAIPRSERGDGKLGSEVVRVLIPPILLIVAVLGSILAGIATPTEASAVGAVGSLLLAGVRVDEPRARPVYAAGLSLIVMLVVANTFDLRVTRNEIPVVDMLGIAIAIIATLTLAYGLLISISRLYSVRIEGSDASILSGGLRSTMEISSLVFVILIGASLFSLVFRGFGGDDLVQELLVDMPGGVYGALSIVMLVMFILGFFLDFLEITFVVIPIVSPSLLLMGLDPIWLGVMMAMNLQTSFLTPPFGFALFYLRGVAPASITTGQIYRGVVPFIGIQLGALLLLVAFPALATWLPLLIR